MRDFDVKCQNISSPDFSKNCSEGIMKEQNINIEEIGKCINQTKKSKI